MSNETRPKGLLISGMISKTAQTENTNNFQMIPIEKLVAFFDHPFKPYTEEELEDLVESIKEIGIMHPIVARKKEDGNLEILSGHNRTEAARRAGFRDVPVKILNVDDDTAKMIVTETNLKQREKIAHSDKAKAYKMQLEALKRQGKRTDLLSKVERAINIGANGPEAGQTQNLNIGANGPEVKYARDIVADMNNTSAKQISRYIRLNYLQAGLLEKVDLERVPFRSGVELSYLDEELQDMINTVLDFHEALTVSIQVASELRALPKEQSAELNSEELELILSGKQPKEPETENAKKHVPFKIAFRAAEKQFKRIEPDVAARLDEKKLELIVVEAIQKYLAELG